MHAAVAVPSWAIIEYSLPGPLAGILDGTQPAPDPSMIIPAFEKISCEDDHNRSGHICVFSAVLRHPRTGETWPSKIKARFYRMGGRLIYDDRTAQDVKG